MAKFFANISRALQKNKTITPPTRRTLDKGALINGRFRVDAEIARGGMGIVYRAYDLPNQRDVAIKVIDLEKANALSLQQFAHEADIATRLRHPHIVSVYETGTVDTGQGEPLLFIVMEWVQGTSLEKMHGFTYARIMEIGKQICEALEYAHQQGFVYRDLKPGNVLIEKRGFQYFVKLTDFGLARPRGVAYLDTESSLAGSFFYLAPELIAGQPADIASDLYALGATLYEMITGRVPFSDFDEKTILAQHLEEAVVPPSQSRNDVPPALEAMILRLLAKEPRSRFGSAHAVWDALEEIKLAYQSSARRGNLPTLPTAFTQDENKLSQVKQLLAENRLVTILGDDEIFAWTLSTQIADEFSDGAWWVELRSVSDPALVIQTVASTLGVDPDPDRALTISLINDLREKNILLLILHCDHLLGACAQLTETILSMCPDVYMLVVSHQPLNISAEKCIRLTP